MHRIVGTYILMPVLLPSMGIAVALQYTNGPADNDFLINLLNALFVVGWYINVDSDAILRNLRRPGETG